MTDLDALLAGIVADPREETRWLVLADWLEEYDDPRRGELLRLHRKMLATCCEPDAHPQRAGWQARMVELLVAGVKPCVPQETLTLPGRVRMKFSFIPPGAFLMGRESGPDTQRPVHHVEVPRGFFIGIFPVTQAQWFAVMGTTPSYFKGKKRPVEKLSWDDCQAFCARLSESSNHEVALPTEAEWEYACRAGTTTDFHFGDVINTDVANYAGGYSRDSSTKGRSRKKTTDVGSFPANPWGLYDVHGNVWEWCQDRFRNTYDGEFQSDPQEQPSGDARVLRGGVWHYDSSVCRAAYRSWGWREAWKHGSILNLPWSDTSCS